MRKISFDSSLLPFIFFYAVIYMSTATFSTYINIYYKGAGYSVAQIGMLAAIGPMVSIAAQPLWGILSDRTNKKRVLLIVITGATVATLLFSLRTTFIYICAVAMLYHGCNTSISPLGDAVTLQFIKQKNIKFSSIRMVGTISYALMAAGVGYILAGNVRQIFFINASILFSALLMVLWMPTPKRPVDEEAVSKAVDVASAPSKTRSGVFVLFQNKMLVCVFLSSFVFGLTMTFYHSFLGLRLTEMGADTGQVGVAMLVSAFSEIPVLLLINKVFAKRKPVHLLMMTGLLLALRMLLLYSSTTVAMVYAAQLLHGLTFMIPYYFSVLLLDQFAPAGLKSTAQSVYAMFRGGAAALLGNVGGGFLAQTVGIRNVYLLLAVIVSSACFLLPGVLLLVYNIRKGAKKS